MICVPGMFQVLLISDTDLFSPCPSRLLLCVRVLTLKEYENLHIHFDDCVGRRVTNASGAFWSLLKVQEALAMPSTLVYSTIFSIHSYRSLCLFRCTPSLRLEYRVLLD